jgi:general stress protein 26
VWWCSTRGVSTNRRRDRATVKYRENRREMHTLATSHARDSFARAARVWYTGAMTRPAAEPVDPTRLREYALAVVAADRFPYLATMEGDQPRLRPVSPVRTGGFTVYVANLRRYAKTAQIAANPKVELCYLDDRHDQVRITGRAEVLTDRALLQEIWDANPLLRQYLGNLDNPELIVYRIVPSRVRFMREWALEYYEVPIT